MLEVYPIGKAPVPEALDSAVVTASIEAIAALPTEVRRAVDGCRDLDHPIREGAWSIRVLVHHLADSHMNAYVREDAGEGEQHVNDAHQNVSTAPPT